MQESFNRPIVQFPYIITLLLHSCPTCKILIESGNDLGESATEVLVEGVNDVWDFFSVDGVFVGVDSRPDG